MLRVDDLDYVLPPECVATEAVEPRDAARLMVLSRRDPARIEHVRVRDLPNYLSSGDAMVVNASRVIPARVIGVRADSGGAIEGLYLGPATDHAARGDAPHQAGAGEPWRIMLKGRRLKPGVRLDLFNVHRPGREPTGVSLRLVERSSVDGESGAWVAQCEGLGVNPSESAIQILDRIGGIPLPPYIRAARKREHEAEQPAVVPEDIGPTATRHDPIAEARDADRYQTVYAARDQPGSVAAPTAGLHFTPELLASLTRQGVSRSEVVLHVGTGTFKSVETEFVEQHPMHAEWCKIPAIAGRQIAQARAAGGRVLAIGTTSARTLESFTPDQMAREGDLARWTKILITPGHAWQNVDAMLTNFHLPRSTLMAMIASLLDERSGGAGDGVARLQSYYAEAIRLRYRFYSYGDAMLVLP